MTPDQLKAWRARMGWTQKRAAAELGVTTRNYQYLEYGKARVTKTIEKLVKLLEAA